MNTLLAGLPEQVRDKAVTVLKENGIDAAHATSAAAAKDLLDQHGGIDFVVIGDTLPEISPFDLYNYILEFHPDTPAVILTPGMDEAVKERRPEKVIEYEENHLDLALETMTDMIETAVEFQAETLYPTPEDEDERLEVLASFDFDALEGAPFYDRLTRLAATFFDVPMCYVGIVREDEETFLTCHGTNFDDIEREQTICSYAIIRDDVMVVDDVQEDERFKDMEALHELDITWYASAPVTVDGHRIGTFCLADHSTRTFTEEDLRHLTLFAEEFADQLQHHRDGDV